MVKRKSRKSLASKSKSSFVDKLFSIKKIFVYSVVITFALFTYKTSYIAPSQVVEGTSTTDEYPIYTKAELDSLAKANPTAFKFTKYVTLELWKDDNGNGKRNSSDGCIAKKYTFKINGNTKTRTQRSDCDRSFIKVTKNCNTLTFVKTNTSNKYTFTAIEYRDSDDYYKITNNKKVTVCGYPEAGGDEVGYLYNEVNFGVKAQ